VESALEHAGLADRGDDDVSSFSRGMRQRLALERALAHQPRLLLLDEPFTGLDDRAVSIVCERLKQLAANGAIVVLATHDLDLADGLVTRLAVVRGGRLVSDEPAGAGLRSRYRALVGGGTASASLEPLRGAKAPSNSGGGGVPAASNTGGAPRE
jgi:ABC-type multidrug transport system ATPase subunit